MSGGKSSHLDMSQLPASLGSALIGARWRHLSRRKASWQRGAGSSGRRRFTGQSPAAARTDWSKSAYGMLTSTVSMLRDLQS